MTFNHANASPLYSCSIRSNWTLRKKTQRTAVKDAKQRYSVSMFGYTGDATWNTVVTILILCKLNEV